MTFKTLFRKSIKILASTLIGGLLAFQVLPFPLVTSRLALAAPSFAIGFNVDKAQAARSEAVTYTLVVTNNGDVNLTNVNIYETSRPPFTTYVNGSSVVTKSNSNTAIADAWYSQAGGTNLGALTPGQALSFKWSVSVNSDALLGQNLENVISIKTAELQNPQGYRITFTVAQNPARNSICASKSVDKSSASVGDTLTFTITVCNDGDIDQTNILLFDKLPKELDYKAGTTTLTKGATTISISDGWIGKADGADGSGINVAKLNSGEDFKVKFQALLNSQAKEAQKIENVGQVKSDQKTSFIQCATSFTAKVVAAAASTLSINKKIRLPSGSEVDSVDKGTHVYVPGEEVTYRLFIGNSGGADASKVFVNDLLPPYIFWIKGDGGYAAGENKVNFDIGTLKAGESRTLTYTAKVRDNIPAGQTNQENVARIFEDGAEKGVDRATVVIGKPGAILAAAVLPVTGSIPSSLLFTFSLLTIGFVLRLRRIKIYKYWNV